MAWQEVTQRSHRLNGKGEGQNERTLRWGHEKSLLCEAKEFKFGIIRCHQEIKWEGDNICIWNSTSTVFEAAFIGDWEPFNGCCKS